MPDPVQPREGEIAFALSVNTLYDLTIGRVAWPVRFTRHSHPTDYTLTLANRTPGGPILNILPVNPDTGELDVNNPILQIFESGIQSQFIGGFIDFAFQSPAPPFPGAGTDTLRLYSRGGRLFYKTQDSGEQEIASGPSVGPTMRWAYWMSGG